MLCNIVLQCFAGSFKLNQMYLLSLSLSIFASQGSAVMISSLQGAEGCLKGWHLTISPSHPFVSLRPARGTIAKRCVPWSDFNPSHRDGVLEFWTTPWAHLILRCGLCERHRLLRTKASRWLDHYWKLKIEISDKLYQTFRRFFHESFGPGGGKCS